MNKIISTQYFLQQKLSHKTFLDIENSPEKKRIMQRFYNLCENNPKDKYLLFKKQIIQETLVESEDYGQLTMNLV